MRWLADRRVLLPLPVTFDAALSFCFALVRPSQMSALAQKQTFASHKPMSAKCHKRTSLVTLADTSLVGRGGRTNMQIRPGWRTASGWAVRSFGVVTFSAIACGEHMLDGAFPQLFGWLLQSGQAVGGELY